MKISDLGLAQVQGRLAGDGLGLAIGCFDVCLKSNLPRVARGITDLYADYEVARLGGLLDFHIGVGAPGILRRWLRPQVRFSFDGQTPFKPLPQAQSFAMFEWGLNWCIANHVHEFLVVHAAVVERGGRALILPGTPGSGKSTLCAALVSRGWRLLSDEMTLVSLTDGLVTPVPRPISLKNASIDVIRRFASDAFIGDVVPHTSKGSIAHVRAPTASVLQGRVSARPAAIVFPRYQQGADTVLTEMSKGQAFMKVADNSFNYPVLGAAGFHALADLIDQSVCHSFVYQHLDEAVAVMDELMPGHD